MKVFSGFPAGKLQVTPLPSFFFTDLLLAIDDLAELKLTLHVFWLLTEHSKSPRSAAGKRRVGYIRYSELRADPTLMQSLQAVGADPEQALVRALGLAVERGTLLRLDVGTGEGGESLYFLNSEAGRRECKALARQEPPSDTVSSGEPAVAKERPNIFMLYEQNIGTLTPLISEELKEAEQEFPADWIADAFKIALKRNVRRWDYISAILKRWKTEGRSDRQKSNKRWWDDEYDKYINR